jgi:hypothetical protein
MPQSERYDQSAVYEIKVKGALDDSWSDWFGGFRLAVQEGKTMLKGSLVDQTALLGVLAKLNDMGLTILTVRRAQRKQQVKDR